MTIWTKWPGIMKILWQSFVWTCVRKCFLTYLFTLHNRISFQIFGTVNKIWYNSSVWYLLQSVLQKCTFFDLTKGALGKPGKVTEKRKSLETTEIIYSKDTMLLSSCTLNTLYFKNEAFSSNVHMIFSVYFELQYHAWKFVDIFLLNPV